MRGTITDSIPATSVTILAGDTLSRTIARADIHLITTEARRGTHFQKDDGSNLARPEPRPVHYQGFISAGFGIKLENDHFFKINFINGIGFSDVFSMGIGIGERIPLDGQGMVTPVFFDTRLRPLATKVSPLTVFGIGLTYQPSKEWAHAGRILYFEAGVSIKTRRSSSFLITIGYETFDRFVEEVGGGNFSNWSGTSMERATVSALTLNLTVGF